MSKFDPILKAAQTPAREQKSPRRRRKTPRAKAEAPKRLPGRRSDPAYLQANAYLPRDLHQAVKIELVKEGREYSELVEELLGNWLRSRATA